MAKSVVVTSTNYQHLRKVNILTSPVTGTSLPVWTTVADDGHNTFETVCAPVGGVPGAATVVAANYVPPDVTAPTITSANTASNAEGSVLAHALTANESVTWSLTGGADLAKFELSGSTLRWASNGTKDYETPDDSNTDNAYVVQVTATDAASNATSQTVTVTVTDVAEGHRYWRVNVTAINTAGHTVAAMVEVQMHTGLTGYGADALEGGTASADTVNGGTQLASGGSDGDLADGDANMWGSTNTAFPHWWKYDFGSGNPKDVNGISIVARNNGADGVGGTCNMMAPKNFNVQYSDDNSAWTTEWSVTGATFAAYEFKHFLNSGVASYSGSPHGAHAHWRIRLMLDNGGNICSAEEIEMRATPGGADQCTGGTPISDGNFSSNVDDNAFDDNTSTFYGSTSTTGAGSNVAYIGYSFVSPVAVAQVAWRCRSSDTAQTPKTFFIQYADSASGPWTTAWGVASSTGWSLGETRLFTDPNYV